MVIGFSVFTYSCSYVQVAWIQRLMAITYWPMQKPLLSAEGPPQKAESTVQRLRHP